MSLSSYNPRNRYRERSVKRFNRTLMFLVLMGGCAVAGFMIGRQNSTVQIATLKKDMEVRDTQLKNIQNELTSVRADAQTATSRLELLRAQYEKDLPQGGPTREIFEMVRQQIEEGMAPERLAFVIRSARPPRNCSDPASKRFVVRTPAYNGPSSTVAVGEGAIVVTGSGESARGRAGQVEAWYDPNQKISVTFKTADGEVEQKTGTLPFQHSLIASGREYRFTLSEGEKSFVKVTFDSCDYP
ncbi:MAG: hypothetical protein KDJ26_06595 [Alphaproteobacteria bacterium]|nr:hypothetical protein [Alphaproteobacteria bacterium]MCB1551652.1 hypothetical protein [Alphaproteobacteria bacterium]MCB9984131.1 hypothetical protein [Micavibrio sp.]HRK96978.1 hypothetical protein [Alphaproteobacteria bacterium]